MKLGISGKIAAVIFLVAVVSVSTIPSILLGVVNEDIEAHIMQMLYSQVEYKMQDVGEFMERAWENFREFAEESGEAMRLNETEKNSRLESFLKRWGIYSSVSIYSPSGGRIAHAGGESPTGVAREGFFMAAMRGETGYDSTSVSSQSGWRREVILSSPIKDETGAVIGVMAAKLPFIRIQQEMIPDQHKVYGEKGGSMVPVDIDVIDSGGKVIYSSNIQSDKHGVFKSMGLLEGGGKKAGADEGFEPFFGEHDGKRIMAVAEGEEELENYKGSGWVLVMTAEADEAVKAFPRLTSLGTRLVVYGTALALASIAATLLFIQYAIAGPLGKVQRAAEEIEKQNYGVTTEIKTGDEFESLGNSMNRITEMLRNSDDERRQLDRAKTEFMSITGHELRSPMTSMKAQLQMLLEGYFGKLNLKQKNSADIVLRNIDRLDAIILDLLEVSRIEAARLKFTFIEADLTPYITSLIDEMKGFMPEKNVTVKLVAPKLPKIEVDPNRVMQVLRNLLNNAIKFSPDNSTVYITAKKLESHILLSVKDSGIGISPANQLRLFEPFYQAENALSRKYGGTGLGLAICRGIIEAQKGTIWLESEVGKGTEFHFTVPYEPTKDMKPIHLLFSRKPEVEKKTRELLLRHLGPFVADQIDEVLRKCTSYDETIAYFRELKNAGVMDEKAFDHLHNELDVIFEIKTPLSAKKVKDLYIEFLDEEAGAHKFMQLGKIDLDVVLEHIRKMKAQNEISSEKAALFAEKAEELFGMPKSSGKGAEKEFYEAFRA